ncbi:hypothetical protein D7Y04_10575 [Corallococcus sp. AB038B]|nr:hypothetical protein D7Y04_10575 [Corallococcus sp. AB038B]
MLVSLVLVGGCARQKIAQEREQDSQVRESGPCPDESLAFLNWRDHLPQGELLRGLCLERALWVERVGDSDDFRAHTATDAEVIDLKITQASVVTRLNGGDTLPLYTVTTKDGRSYCPNEGYAPLPEEIQKHCPPGQTSCAYFEELKGRAMLIPGSWRNNRWSVSGNEQTVSCITGAIAKCIKWGYKPGALLGGDSRKPLGDAFQACVRAARADYFGDGVSYTCANTKIDMYDKWGVNQKEISGYGFESLWDANGLVCLNRARYPDCSNLTAVPDCADPVPGTGQPWTGVRGLIGVSSDPHHLQDGACPAAFDACPMPAAFSR